MFGLCALSALQYLPAAARDAHAFDAWLAAWHDVQAKAAEIEQKGDGRDLFDVLVDYVFATSGLPAPDVQRLLTRRFPDPAMKNKFVSTAQQLRNEGKAEGKDEGKVEGKASILLRQITRRFGEPEAEVVERLHRATRDELDLWADRILDAASLDELFAD